MSTHEIGVAVRAENQHWRAHGAADQMLQQLERRTVCPMQVVEDQQHRGITGHGTQQ